MISCLALQTRQKRPKSGAARMFFVPKKKKNHKKNQTDLYFLNLFQAYEDEIFVQLQKRVSLYIWNSLEILFLIKKHVI